MLFCELKSCIIEREFTGSHRLTLKQFNLDDFNPRIRRTGVLRRAQRSHRNSLLMFEHRIIEAPKRTFDFAAREMRKEKSAEQACSILAFDSLSIPAWSNSKRILIPSRGSFLISSEDKRFRHAARKSSLEFRSSSIFCIIPS